MRRLDKPAHGMPIPNTQRQLNLRSELPITGPAIYAGIYKFHYYSQVLNDTRQKYIRKNIW